MQQENHLVVGGEGPDIEIHSFEDRKLLTKFKAHDKRVKGAHCTTLDTDDKSYLITASNDGFIKIWQLSVSLTRQT